MGFFGKDFNEVDALAGFFGGPQVASTIQRKKQFNAEAQAEAEKLARERQALDAAAAALRERGVPEPDIAALMTDPKRMAEFVSQRIGLWDTGPGGGSRYDPLTNNTRMAPRWDDDNNLYGGTSDASQVPQRLIKGTKVVPVPQGGQAVALDSVTGQLVNSTSGGSVFRKGQRHTTPDGRTFELIGDDDTDPKNWREITGGAGRSGPPMFP